VELAATGAQVIVSLCGYGVLPLGTPVSPVIAVALDATICKALRSDFDIDGTGGDPRAVAEEVTETVIGVFNGAGTAAEQRGAADFVLNRTAVTM
jgi:altronate dehydratase